MPTLLDYLKGVVAEYGPGIRDAALEEVAERAQRVDAKLRDKRTLKRATGGLLDGLLSGLADGWRSCEHGVPDGERCEKCRPELKP